jgi:hypothetical protein
MIYCTLGLWMPKRTEKIPSVIAEAESAISETINRVPYFTPCRLCERLPC